MIENPAAALVLVAQRENALAIIAGAVVGYLVGALPGTGAGVALLAVAFYSLATHSLFGKMVIVPLP
jgi:TctA family transporter